ncbi:MAG: hypothetical protein JSV05_08180 [Candidatus Bathyarchaeota archaeon]|nr:MAG: hypothetical protein JSV05_08180 [Candidatus Bathyarchaeota archaeon]
MTKQTFHPNAYLSEIRNVQQGLGSRTTILGILEKNGGTANDLVNKSKLSYRVVLHHLWLLESEKIVRRKTNKRPYFWTLTGMGQQRLKSN